MKKLKQLYADLENARGGGNSGDIENAWAAISHFQQQKLIAGTRAVQALINESAGVAGLHLNGDVAPWSELRSGGAFENWLMELDNAIEVADFIEN